MPAFDVTASPPQLTLKPGATATVVVTVTNRLGRAVTARADKVVEPATAAAWFKTPPDSQRTFGGPQATEKFAYEVAVPADAPATTVNFRVDVVEVGAPDDNFGQSNTVAVTVPAPEVVPVPTGGGIPGWVWPLVALVIIGAGVGIWLILRGGGKMPNVVGQQYSAAESALAGETVVVTRADSLSAASDTVTWPAGAVMAQTPAPEAKLRGSKEAPDTVRLVVQRDFRVVPTGLVNQTAIEAAGKLGMAGLATKVGWKTAAAAQKDKVLATNPIEGTLAVRGDTVTITVGYVCPAPCTVLYIPDRRTLEAIQRAGTIRDHRRPNQD